MKENKKIIFFSKITNYGFGKNFNNNTFFIYYKKEIISWNIKLETFLEINNKLDIQQEMDFYKGKKEDLFDFLLKKINKKNIKNIDNENLDLNNIIIEKNVNLNNIQINDNYKNIKKLKSIKLGIILLEKDGEKKVFKTKESFLKNKMLNWFYNLNIEKREKNEIDSFKLDQLLGLNITPKCEYFEYEEKKGILQDYIEGKTQNTMLNFEKINNKSYNNLLLLSYLNGNIDIHGENIIKKENRYYGIDNEMSFIKGFHTLFFKILSFFPFYKKITYINIKKNGINKEVYKNLKKLKKRNLSFLEKDDKEKVYKKIKKILKKIKLGKIKIIK